MRKTLARYGIAICLTAAIVWQPVRAYADSKEYLVKAAFIYNFVKFVEWPGDRHIARQSNIDICVLGDSPMSETGSVFKQASTPKLALSLVKENSIDKAVTHCHVLFIGDSESGRMKQILSALADHPVLTVSDIDRFAEQGGMIGFTMQDNKVKLVVNTKAAAQANMRIDAQLLEIALKVISQ